MAGLPEKFRSTAKADGLWAAMRWLNSQVPYRYTAIFAFAGDTLRNICLIDKENVEIANCGDQPVTDSYCIYIYRSGQRFSVEQALLDKRVAGHPRQSNYQCYYGIPLVNGQGKLLGTVCHFGTSPIQVTDDVVTALDDLAPFIAEMAFSQDFRGLIAQ